MPGRLRRRDVHDAACLNDPLQLRAPRTAVVVVVIVAVIETVIWLDRVIEDDNDYRFADNDNEGRQADRYPPDPLADVAAPFPRNQVEHLSGLPLDGSIGMCDSCIPFGILPIQLS